MKSSHYLKRIVKYKKEEVARLKKRMPLAILKSAVKGRKPGFFEKALRSGKGISVIAEIKRKSPSKGILRRDFRPVQIAREYEKSGARAVSVLTDEKFFGGSAEILKKVRKAVRIPILRKEFIIDDYQIYESRLLGADAVLLIAGILSAAELKRFYQLANRLGLDVLFEVHDKRELEKVLPLRPRILGINNRDLRSFHLDIHTTGKLFSLIPKKILVVSESGIRTRGDVEYLRRIGVRTVLVGETLMKEKKVGEALEKLLGRRK